MSINLLIYFPNVHNYQNNFYIQYTSLILKNLYNKEKIEDNKNESSNSIPLSIVVDDLIQEFELD